MAAGFFAGFGEQLSKDVARRQDELGILIKENLANARGAKRDYAKRKSLAGTILDTTQAIQNKYGLKDEQAIALAEAYGTDLPGLQLKLDETDIQVRSTGGVGLGAEQVMSYVNMTNELAPLKGMTKLQAIEKLMGLNTAELAKEADPKSEGSQTRSFIRAALAFDPQLQAAEKMEGIKGPGGMSYAQLLEMQEAGFAPEDVVGGVTRSGGLAYDYTASTAKQTTSTYSSNLSTKLFDVAMDDTIGWDSLSSKDPSLDKKAAKANLLGAGQALARLERSIVLKNLGKDLSLSAFRKGVLDDIYNRIDNPEELKTLQESVANGTALEIVQRTGGDLTEKDIDAIIAGTVGEEELASASQPAAAASVTDLTAAETTTAETTTPLAAQAATLDSNVARMLAEQGIDTGGISNTGLSDEELRLREPSAEYGSQQIPDTTITADTAFLLPKDASKLTSEFLSGEKTTKFLKTMFPDFPSDSDLIAGAENFNNTAAVALSNAASSTIDWFRGLAGVESGASISDWLNGEAERIANKPKVTAKEVDLRKAKVATVFTDALQDAYDFGADVYAEVEENVKQNIARSGVLTDAEKMKKRIQDNDRQFLADERNYPQPISGFVTPAKTKEEKDLEANMIAIDEQKKRIQDMDRQFLADEKNYPQPLKAMTSIEPLSINTPAELDAAIAERVGEMPPDYKEQVVEAVASINKVLTDFEKKANLTVEKVIDTVSPSNLAKAISNLTARVFDETLEERIMKNEGQRNRAAALAKLQEQFAALTLFPERTPVDIKDIDPYPTMAEMASEGLHSTQDKINASIASTAKAFLAKLGIGKSNEEAETKAEPLVARPKKAKKPKEMTSSDKARLKRAQKADQLSGDASLLEMLVEKYGIALVQKEMGL